MAETPLLVPAMVESLSKPVQELVIKGDEMPERYIYNGIIDSSFPLMKVPIIDLSILNNNKSSSPAKEEEEKEELEKLKSALASFGCFQAINHGMTSSFLDEVREVGKKFFALPAEEKYKSFRTVEDTEGYGDDTILSQHQTLDWNDRLYLIVSPEDQRKLKLWPQNPQSFREIMDDYTKKIKVLSELIFKAMAKSLKLEENSLLDQYGERASMIARFNFYPPCPRPDLALGLKPHADGTAITFLLQDKQVEGLQVVHNDQWFRVPIVADALLINVGDQTEIMSNGIFKSPVHRVVTNAERERMTLAMFCMPEIEKEIKPVEDLVTDGRPGLYKKVKNYSSIFFENYQKGKRPIDAVKL